MARSAEPYGFAPLTILAGQYQIIRLLGTGGMGQVYLARDLKLHRVVAVKALSRSFAIVPEASFSFLREAQLGARLEHHGIVSIYAFGEQDGVPFLVMQFLGGGTLADRIRSESLPYDAVAPLLADLADALAYAHRQGVVHRDIKPENVLFPDPESIAHPMIADFGVATRPLQDTGPGERRVGYGTPHFMSPEQAHGDLDIDGRSDLFSLGVLGYLLLTGSYPYDGPSEPAIAAARVKGARTPLHLAAPAAPPALVAAVERCLAPDPANRWQSAGEFAPAIRASVGAPSNAPSGRTPWNRRVGSRRSDAKASPPSSHRRTLTDLISSVPAAVRKSVRSLGGTPVITLAALICLALGLGAVTSIFSALNTALRSPVPFRDPERLVSIYRTTPHFSFGPFSAPNFLDLREQLQTMEAVAAVSLNGGLLQHGDEVTQVRVYGASGNFFPMLGVAPLAGRLILPEDERENQPPVAVLSEETWRSQFGSDPALVGKTIRLSGAPVTVIGILPRGFRVNYLSTPVWIPLRLTSSQLSDRRSNFLLLFGRTRPGSSQAAAQQELVARMNGIIESHPELAGESLRIADFRGEFTRPVREPLLLLFGAVGLVLLIAVANVASLLLARGAERSRQVAVRIALGAPRRTIVLEVFRETALLGFAGVVGGLGLALLAVRLIGRLAAAQLPQLRGLSINWTVMGFAVLLAGLVVMGCGLVPAVRAASGDPQDALRAGARTGGTAGQQRFLRGLILSEVALAFVLVLGAGLVLRGFLGIIRRDPGFDPRPVLTAVIDLADAKYQKRKPVQDFLEPALARIRAIPAVVDAGAINLIPYDNWGWNWNVRYEGMSAGDPTRYPIVENRSVTPELFGTLGIRLLKGRLLDNAIESDTVPINVLVNQALVDRDLKNEEPIGKRFYVNDSTFGTIIGVVSSIRNVGPLNEPAPEMYWSYRTRGNSSTSFPLVVRVKQGDPVSVANDVVRAVKAVDPGAAVSQVRPLGDVIDTSVGRQRFYLVLLEVFAAVALALAIAGLYGLTRYAVSRRTREIGIRTALGATPAQTVTLVLRDGMVLIFGGLLMGGGIALLATRLLRNLLYGVSSLDPLAWVLVASLLVMSGAIASLLPARRAARVDPLQSIRTE